jgi:pyrrolidone-carboxylate peptidase
MPKIPEVAKAPVATRKDDQALNQFHDAHHDWRFGFRVGQAEGTAESCEENVEVSIQVLDRNQTQKRTLAQSDISPQGAEAFFVDVVARGIRF